MKCLANGLISDELSDLIISWPRDRCGYFRRIRSLFLWAKRVFRWRSLYGICLLFVCKWTWYEFGELVIVDSLPQTFSKLRMSIIFILGIINVSRFVITRSRKFSTLLGINIFVDCDWTHGVPKLHLFGIVVWLVGSWTRCNWAILSYLVVYKSHGVLGMLNYFWVDVVCTGSKLLGRGWLIECWSLSGSKYPLGSSLRRYSIFWLMCAGTRYKFCIWRSCHLSSFLLANTECSRHLINIPFYNKIK